MQDSIVILSTYHILKSLVPIITMLQYFVGNQNVKQNILGSLYLGTWNG